jgi:hypothetical protein
MGRRAVLRGLGACVALPSLESLAQTSATVPPSGSARPIGTTPSGAPLRMVFVGFPNGVNLSTWRPEGEGAAYVANKTFAPIAPFREKFQILTGFAQLNANDLGDGPGDHARANATFLTGAHPRKTAGADIRNGISVDQVAAQRLRGVTRLPSLELISVKSRRSGSCDSGYSCAYEYNLSWASPTVPAPAEADPRQVFERLFGAGEPGERQRLFLARQRQRHSLLDFVREETRVLERQIGVGDRQKLDEYLVSLREVERQIEEAERFKLPTTHTKTPDSIPEDFYKHISLMTNLLALALVNDSTRVATFLFANEGNNRSFVEIGIPEGHHHVSHHQKRADYLEKYARIDLFYMEQFARLLRLLDNAREANGKSVLDNSMILYGCANSDGDRHNHDDLPLVLAGRGGGLLASGRHLKLKESTPLNNLYLTLLDHMGTPTEKLGDSTAKQEDV